MPPDIVRDIIIPQNHPDFDIAWQNPVNEKCYTSLYFERMYFKHTPIFYVGAIYPFNYYHSLDDSVEFIQVIIILAR